MNDRIHTYIPAPEELDKLLSLWAEHDAAARAIRKRIDAIVTERQQSFRSSGGVSVKYVTEHLRTDYERTMRRAGFTVSDFREAPFVKRWVTIDWHLAYKVITEGQDVEPTGTTVAERTEIYY